jgi:hypothetical protein
MKLLIPFLLLTLTPEPNTIPVDPFCADLRLILRAASEQAAFRSLESRREDQWFGGLASCRRIEYRGINWRCQLSTGSVPDGRPGLLARTRSCLPDAVTVLDEPVRDGRLRDSRSLVDIGRSRIAIDEVGGPRMHQGWYYTYTVYAKR